jgi:hypothetical protein
MSNEKPPYKNRHRASAYFPRRAIRNRQINPKNQPTAAQPNSQKENRSAWDKLNVGMTTTATVVIALGAIVTGVVGYYQWRALQGTDNAIHRQLALMESDQRPRISLEMFLIEPFINDADGSHIDIGYKINNVGKSPAVSVNFLATMLPLGNIQPAAPTIPPGFAVRIPSDEINSAAETICEEQDGLRDAFKTGEIMFPNIPQTRKWRVRGLRGPGFIPGFVVIGCVTYRFEGDLAIHRTIRIFDLSMQPYGQMINLGAESIHPGDLAFFPHSENGSRAD